MSKYKKLTVLLKRTQYLEVVISEENGWTMPDDFDAMYQRCKDIENRPDIVVEEDDEWVTEDGIQLVEFGVVEVAA